MNSIKFSVVVPLFNKQRSILDALQSIKDQKHSASEIIVVDDGSTDDGAKLVEQLNWPNLKLIKQQNQGVSHARNRGVLNSLSPYIAFLDADDKWLPFHLYEMARLIKRFPEQGFYACRYQQVVANQEFRDAKIQLNNLNCEGYVMEDYLDIASKGNLPFITSSMAIRKRLYIDLGGFPCDQWMGEDQFLFIRAALDKQIAYSPQIHVQYHVDGENRACDKKPPSQACEFSTMLLDMLDQQTLEKSQHIPAARYYAAHICDLAKRNVLAGYPKVALGLLKDPLCKYKPLHRSYWFAQALLKAIAQYLGLTTNLTATNQ